MKSLIEKRRLFLALFVFIAPHALYASESISQPSQQIQKDYRAEPRPNCKLLVFGYCRAYNLPKEIYFMIARFALPEDLSNQDLSGFDFTGYKFTDTNLTDTNLDYVILTNTICDYRKAFENNLKENKCEDGDWYKENLPKDLKSIAEVYPNLKKDADKAKLLHIACGLSRLPFYTSKEFCIKVQYWSCALLKLKQQLNNKQLVCSLDGHLNNHLKNYCWSTEYPKNDVNLDEKNPHADFEKYLRNFSDGLVKYKCESSDIFDFYCYKGEIENNIKGIQEAYSEINNKKLQKEACQIACALSKSYQIGGMAFLFHYLFYQNRLIRLKNSIEIMVKSDIYYKSDTLCNAWAVEIMVKNDIHYSALFDSNLTKCWDHGKKGPPLQDFYHPTVYDGTAV